MQRNDNVRIQEITQHLSHRQLHKLDKKVDVLKTFGPSY